MNNFLLLQREELLQSLSARLTSAVGMTHEERIHTLEG